MRPRRGRPATAPSPCRRRSSRSPVWRRVEDDEADAGVAVGSVMRRCACAGKVASRCSRRASSVSSQSDVSASTPVWQVGRRRGGMVRPGRAPTAPLVARAWSRRACSSVLRSRSPRCIPSSIAYLSNHIRNSGQCLRDATAARNPRRSNSLDWNTRRALVATSRARYAAAGCAGKAARLLPKSRRRAAVAQHRAAAPATACRRRRSDRRDPRSGRAPVR